MSKKIGWFFMSSLPLAVCVGLQLVIGVGAAVLYGGFKMVLAAARGISTMDGLMNVFMDNIMDGTMYGVFGYHVFGSLIFMLWLYLAKYRRQGIKRAVSNTLNVRGLSGKAFIVAVLAGVFLCIMANALIRTASHVTPGLIKEYEQLMEQAGFGSSILLLIASVLLAPIGEEILCRGLIMFYAEKVSSKFWVANLIQALMFGIMHMNIVQGTYAFILGLVMGWLCKRYRSLLIPIIIHFIVNLSSSTWAGILFFLLPDSLIVSGTVLFLAAGACAFTLWWAGKPKETEAPGPYHDNPYMRD